MRFIIAVIQIFSWISIVSSDDIFWLSVELMNIEWRKGCLTTAGCAEPRFKMIETNAINSEKLSISWAITEDLVQDRSRAFVTHWKHGQPSDVTLGCEVSGVDPTYGFTRTCDSTTNVRMFQKTVDEEFLLNRVGEMELPVVDESGKMLVEMRGKCFNATLAIEKHDKRCPWCVEHTEVAVVGHQLPDDDPSSEFMRYFGMADQLVYITVIVLTVIAVASSGAFACLLIAYLRQKRNSEELSSVNVKSKARFGVYHDNCHRVHVESLHGSDDSTSSRYETPWDQKYHALPHWLSNRSDATSTSAIDTVSTLTGPMSNHNSRSTIGTCHLKLSPNLTTVCDRHDDSGLESV
ncbi:unnamed protein product [Anisakis simplex]|uniref:Ig-like domain-containing protein n=1 Tax=Anisakis simplex TaxID=6269 RepID=A0A0M3K243_ANISI|nr:unnamed protein product [Anisakis simplex]